LGERKIKNPKKPGGEKVFFFLPEKPKRRNPKNLFFLGEFFKKKKIKKGEFFFYLLFNLIKKLGRGEPLWGGGLGKKLGSIFFGPFGFIFQF